MKKTKLLSGLILKEFIREKRKYILLIGIFLIGVISGTVSSALNDTMTELQSYIDTFLSAYSIQGTAKSQVFFISLLNYLKFAFFLWISGWYLWLIPLCVLQVFSKGFRIGYTVACFIRCYHIKGIILSLLTMLPQNFIFLPGMFFFAVYQFHFLSSRRTLLSGKHSAGHQKNIYLKNVVLLLMFLLLILFCSILEGYVIPTLLQPLCKFML